MLALTEEWRNALDRHEYVAAILMDLSKAFDCLPSDLITEKLRANGLSNDAVDLIHDYLSDRKQCVKTGEQCSSFQRITKGVPQGSILGPLIFDIFLNDIFYFIEKGKFFPNFATLLKVLEQE